MEEKKPEPNSSASVVIGVPRPAYRRPPDWEPPVFRRTKRIKFNGIDIDCSSVDFESKEMPWQTIKLENGDIVQWFAKVIEIYDTHQIADGDPVYIVKISPPLYRIAPLGGSRTPEKQGLGEHIATDYTQGPREDG